MYPRIPTPKKPSHGGEFKFEFVWLKEGPRKDQTPAKSSRTRRHVSLTPNASWFVCELRSYKSEKKQERSALTVFCLHLYKSETVISILAISLPASHLNKPGHPPRVKFESAPISHSRLKNFHTWNYLSLFPLCFSSPLKVSHCILANIMTPSGIYFTLQYITWT